jgi:hypothetical protein
MRVSSLVILVAMLVTVQNWKSTTISFAGYLFSNSHLSAEEIGKTRLVVRLGK